MWIPSVFLRGKAANAFHVYQVSPRFSGGCPHSGGRDSCLWRCGATAWQWWRAVPRRHSGCPASQRKRSFPRPFGRDLVRLLPAGQASRCGLCRFELGLLDPKWGLSTCVVATGSRYWCCLRRARTCGRTFATWIPCSGVLLGLALSAA